MPEKNRTAKGVLGGLLGLVGLSAVAGVLVTATVTPAIAVAGAAGSQALELFDKLPSYLEVTAPIEPTTIYATGEDGNPVQLATFYDQIREPVTFNEITPIMYDAILSSEDKDFFVHGGINVGSTLKALVDNVRGTSSRGASTISQQYVKNVLVQQCEQNVAPGEEDYDAKLTQCWTDATNARGADGVQRKLQEMRYAIQIENVYSKNDILLGYLNLANFGGQVYGIEAAAKRYFSKTAQTLTIAEAATLAGMVQNPNRLRIDRPDGSTTDGAGAAVNSAADGYAATLQRRNYVLGRLLADGKVTQAQYDEAYATPIVPALTQPTQGCSAAGTSAYFCQYVRSVVLADDAFGTTLTERLETLQRDGLEIYTSLDLRIQDRAVEALQSRVPAAIDEFHLGAASVAIETTTGRVLSMAQNTQFSETESEDQSLTGLVFASDKAHGGSGGFPVGSTYKAFTLIDWLEKGHSVNERLDGRNRVMSFDLCEGETGRFDTKTIGNFGNASGSVGTPMSFTASSLNSGYFAMAEKLKICDINAVADRLGVGIAKGGTTTDENYPYNVLGDKYIAPLDMAGAYGAIANDGIYCTPQAIDKVLDQSGNELPKPESTCTQALTPEVAATAAYALAGVMNGGTGRGARVNDGVPTIGKTGTHQEYSTMMIQSSTKVATAVWVGRSEGDEPIWNRSANGGLLQNARYGISRDTQAAANAIYGGDRFPGPSATLTKRPVANLPNVVGMTVDAAKAELERQGFSVTVGAPVASTQPQNIVAAQSPGAGQVSPGITVTIAPSNGAALTVPAVTGSQSSAIQTLHAVGFNTVVADASCSNGNGNGNENKRVTSTSPPAGSPGTPDTTITLLCGG